MAFALELIRLARAGREHNGPRPDSVSLSRRKMTTLHGALNIALSPRAVASHAAFVVPRTSVITGRAPHDD